MGIMRIIYGIGFPDVLMLGKGTLFHTFIVK